MHVTDLLKLTNTVLEAAIVILISSVLLYSIKATIRNRVARASNLLLAFTVVAYLGDLLLTQVSTAAGMERWLRLQWVGIAFVPSAYLHLSNALYESSGNTPRNPWRRFAVWAAYGCSAITLSLSARTDLIVHGTVANLATPQLQPGILFPLFSILFGAFIALGAAYQFQARRRSRTATMRRRITYLIASAGGPVVSVFPYLLLTSQNTIVPPSLFWIIQIVGNSVVGITIFFMTYSVAYFGVSEPDRVVRLRLIKFLARGPLVAIGVLVTLVAAGRVGRFLGIPAEQTTPFLVVGGIVFFQWIILLIKPTLERLFYFDERAQVIRIQELRDRVLTTRDLEQFLENVLASICELLQVETAFVASFTSDGSPRVELIVGNLAPSDGALPVDGWQSLSLDPRSSLPAQGERFTWDGFWILSLYDHSRETVLGILGIQTPDDQLGLTPEQIERLNHLAQQAADTLEDQILQQEVFSAMEGLLQKVKVAQRRRQAATFEPALGPADKGLIQGKDFTSIVRDALSHYWGGPKLTQSPLLKLQIVKQEIQDHQGSSINAMRSVLVQAIESLRPEGDRSMTTAEWILYNILELKFLKRYKVRDVARRLAMSESDLYRKQRIAVEAVAQAITDMEQVAKQTITNSSEPEQALYEQEKDRQKVNGNPA
jgi:hypothetical protein